MDSAVTLSPPHSSGKPHTHLSASPQCCAACVKKRSDVCIAIAHMGTGVVLHRHQRSEGTEGVCPICHCSDFSLCGNVLARSLRLL